MNYSNVEDTAALYAFNNLPKECNTSTSNGGYDFDDCSWFTFFGNPNDMSEDSLPSNDHRSGSTSRIPRCAQRPRQMASANRFHQMAASPRPSPRPNYSFQPVFHERKTHEDDTVLTQELWKLARKSGTLNLSNKGLASVPERLYDINEADAESKAATLEQLSIKDEDAWWNQVPLTNLDLSSNALSHISPKIENLQSLTVLILHDNALVALPAEIGKLEKLMRLNVSRNKLSDLPRELYSLPELRHLNISYNEFSELNPDISDLHMLEFLDAGHNSIKSLPGGIGFLVRLTALLLPYNHIKDLPPDLVNMRSLQRLDLMQNDLTCLPEDMGLLRKLQFLYIQHNDIMELSDFEGNETLTELHASNNYISNIPISMCENLPHLKVLDLRDNKITQLPDELCLLRNLNRLDVSNNSIDTLPVSLAALAHLISLQVEGNPIKSIRRDILQCGTSRILRTLQERSMAKSKDEGESDSGAGARLCGGQAGNDTAANYPDSYQPQHQQKHFEYQFQYRAQAHMQPQAERFRVYEPPHNCPPYSRQGQEHVYDQENYETEKKFDYSGQYMQQQQHNFRFNGYSAMYQQQQQLFYGQCVVCPRWVYKLRHTRTLAVNLEEITDVPEEVFQLAQKEGVHVVDFARNQLRTVPDGLQHMQNIVTELVLAHNRIGQVPQFISQFTRITLLNLSNNLLTDLPKEFGVLNTLRELNIANNRFSFLPSGLYDLQGLEILIASDNHINELNVAGLQRMPRLSTLDLRNNDIDFIPPILGTLTNITHLELVGNPFRQPRHQILMKGTESIMSYLRDRVPR
ncbi:leucine-rich repeat-containing protein 40 isoform X2 [Drosophila pseudoobscura]|uniref:Leucine-rich repeat-containing protein 40 isoform X2 n=1 Tax=Drosophila pseudoobscura pseudoobscura TaxID=46245 RepID=A0A6I8VUC4_DROPS|nr:leucine-rich repeat-containing protein 40 isoform X2 [Drosophila pseudoobscura]